MVVYNPAITGSEDVARYYQDFREIPEENLCSIFSLDPDAATAEQYEDWIKEMQGCADVLGGRILYVVPVWGVPYTVSGRIDDIGIPGVVATVSLDALAHPGVESWDYTFAIYAPLYQDGSSLTQESSGYKPAINLRRKPAVREPFPHVYLVSRIDGSTAEDAMALVDRTAEAEFSAQLGALAGTVYVDGQYGDVPPTTDLSGSYEAGEWNMWGTRYLFEDLSWYNVHWDGNGVELGTEPALTTCPEALYYAGWYAYYNYNDCFEWAPGAIGGHLDSCSACAFRTPGSWAYGALQDGITATFGAVAEPYVAGMPEYDQFFLYLTSGVNFGEAAYESTIVGLWMMVWIGDPLYRPYAI